MEESTEFKLSNHGVFLLEELRRSYREVLTAPLDKEAEIVDKYARLVFPDGSVRAHGAILTSVSPFLSKVFQSNWATAEDSVMTLFLPDYSAIEASHLIELLYTGMTILEESTLERLMDLTKTLKLMPIPVAAVDPEAPDPMSENIEVSLLISSTNKVAAEPEQEADPNTKSAAEEEVGPKNDDDEESVRHSKRPRIKTGNQRKTKMMKLRWKDDHTTIITETTEPDEGKEKEVTNGENNYVPLKMTNDQGAIQFLYKERSNEEESEEEIDEHLLETFLEITENIQVQSEKKKKRKKSLNCPNCDESFSSKSGLNFHRKKHDNWLKCDVCNQENFQHVNDFIKHMETGHNCYAFKCDVCGNRYKHASTLRYHVDIHTPEPSHLCDICGKKFRAKDQCASHRRLHGARRLQCDFCPATFKQRNVLRQHKMIIHEPKRFQCDYCPKKFSTKQNLLTHTRVHTGEAPYSCSICYISFKRDHHLKKHVNSQIHLDKIADLKAQGKEIPQSLDPEGNKIHQEQQQQNGSEEWTCDLCPKSVFRSDYHFQKHIRGRSHIKRLCQQTNIGMPIAQRLIPSELIIGRADEDDLSPYSITANKEIVPVKLEDGEIVIVTENGDLSIENNSALQLVSSELASVVNV